MGGTPALGAGMVLPKLSQHQLNSLSSTESPAARELHAAQGRPDEAMSTSPPPSVNTPTNSPPWLVGMRVSCLQHEGPVLKEVFCVLDKVNRLHLKQDTTYCATKSLFFCRLSFENNIRRGVTMSPSILIKAIRDHPPLPSSSSMYLLNLDTSCLKTV